MTIASEQRPSTADGTYQRSRGHAMGDYGNRSINGEPSHARPFSSMRDTERDTRNRPKPISPSIDDRVVRKKIGNPADILQRFQASPSSSFQMVDAEIKISLAGKARFCESVTSSVEGVN